MTYLSLLALMAGAAIATQASMNAYLGLLLKNSMFATMVAFTVSCIFTLSVLMLTTKQYPEMSTIRSVPWYLWFSGGALSAFAVALFYFLIPKMGVGPMMSYALAGQIIIAMVASHYGWFELPIKPLSVLKTIGVFALILGVILINLGPSHVN